MSTPVFFCAFRFGYTEAIIYTVNYSSKLKSLKENIYLKYKNSQSMMNFLIFTETNQR